MREIKFRQRINGKFHYWGLIEGSFVGPSADDKGENPVNTEHQQYTGLKDKSEKEIYEGDLISDVKGDVREVVFSEGGFWCEYPNGEKYMPVKEHREIMGNIYDKKSTRI